MANKQTKKKTAKKSSNNCVKVQSRSYKDEIWGVVLIVLGILIGLAAYSSSEVLLAVWARVAVFGLFGLAGYAVPVLFAIWGIMLIAIKNPRTVAARTVFIVIGVLALLTFIHFCYYKYFETEGGFFAFLANSFVLGKTYMQGGGFFGAILAYPFDLLMGQIGSMVLFGAIVLISIMIVTSFSVRSFGVKIGEMLSRTGREVEEESSRREERRNERRAIKESMAREKPENRATEAAVSREKYRDPQMPYEDVPAKNNLFVDCVSSTDAENARDLDIYKPKKPSWERYKDAPSHIGATIEVFDKEIPQEPPFEAEDLPPWEENDAYDIVAEEESYAPAQAEESYDYIDDISEIDEQSKMDAAPPQSAEIPKTEEYVKPPVSLLTLGTPARTKGVNDADQKAVLLERTLSSFGVSAKVIGASMGPVVTRYELQPAPGVKVSRIVNLSDDIALALAADSIRIEAPIPGKAAIGIEVPKTDRAIVRVRDLIDTDEFRSAKSKLTFALGKDISGKNIYADLMKMPHLLVAGTTGSGKSVCLDTMIVSMLYNASPEEVQMIMVDPKQVTMKMYNGIPHLRIPVVTDARKAASALVWAVTEMTQRYKLFSELNYKDIDRFNANAIGEGMKPLPKLVIFIDEFADLMMVGSKEVEDSVCRIAQLGRAAGIHLVVATQTPRKDVLTGMIKANIPSRISLSVMSQIDSRVILDMNGAEKLIGNGDMLYYPVGSSKTIRIQGCLVEEEEVLRVKKFLSQRHTATYDESVMQAVEAAAESKGDSRNDSTAAEDMDELLQDAVKLAIENEQVSVSMLQRRFRIGYARAGRIVDEMEELGIVSPADGSKPRNVLMTWEGYRNMFMEDGDDIGY